MTPGERAIRFWLQAPCPVAYYRCPRLGPLGALGQPQTDLYWNVHDDDYRCCWEARKRDWEAGAWIRC